METPRIAIIGSPWMRDANGGRVITDASLAHERRARGASEELGRELANAGCRLLVYSAEEYSMERAVVSGFVAVTKKRHEIEWRHPWGAGGSFPEQALTEEPINDRVDPADTWVVSFYRSLRDADGVLLMGGGATALIAGHVAIGFGRPVAALAAFGGSASKVWKDLKQVGDLTDEEYDAMGRSWGAGSARTIVSSLVRRHAAKVDRERQRFAQDAELKRYRELEADRLAGRRTWLITAAAFIAFPTLMVIGQTRSTTGAGFFGLLIGALTLAGVTGAGLKLLRGEPTAHHARALLYGAVAGFVLSILYLAPHLAGDQSLLSSGAISASVRWQIVITPILALAGGLAADSVLTSLQKSGESGAVQLAVVPLHPGDASKGNGTNG